MAIPISYNLRNLMVRKTTTIMTALGVGLTVAVLLAVLALVQGLSTAFQATGEPLNLLVTRQGADAELTSNFTRTQFQDLKFKPGIAKGKDGQPLVSMEIVSIVSLPALDNPQGVNISLRGLSPVGIELRSTVKLREGRWFNPGRREVVVGKGVAKRNPTASLGKEIFFGKGNWTVVGVMDAGDSAFNSEVWADLNQIASDFNRQEVASSALVRAEDEVSMQALLNNLNSDQRLAVKARTEREYYAAQTNSALPIQVMGIFVSIIMAVGSSFAAMNTMFAAVSRRSREIGTLRVLGFSKGSILLSFVLESIFLSVIGGLIGCVLVLPLNGVSTSVGSFTTFSEVAFNFHVSPGIMVAGVLFATLMGTFGGLFPASSAARKQILVALKEI